MFSLDNTSSSTTTDTQMYGKLKRYWRRNRYQRLYPADYGTVNSYDDEVLLSTRKKRYSKVARFGSADVDTHQNNKNMGPMRRRRMGVSLKMRLKRFLVTPVVRILGRIRNGYINMMLGITGDVGNGVFGGKRIPKARQVEEKKNKKVSSSDMEQFETKLVYEIYKVLAASRQFSTIEAATKRAATSTL